jgi:hypothetical protein
MKLNTTTKPEKATEDFLEKMPFPVPVEQQEQLKCQTLSST